MMNGYVKNMTHLWNHVMKRSIGPGATIPLQELYDQYGARHNLDEGPEFIQWLKDVKLRDRDKWRIFTDEDKPYEAVVDKKDNKVNKVQETGLTKAEDTAKAQSRGDNTTPIVPKELTVDDVVELSVRQAREIIPEIRDIKLLKYAENNARQRAGKDSLRRILMKRIQELEVSNRR
jgi:hypothetical protein